MIPLESANLGRADRDGNIHEIHRDLRRNDLVPKINEMFAKGTPIEEGFYSSTA